MFQFESKGHLQKHLKDSIVTEVTKRGNLRERFVAQIEKFLPVMQETKFDPWVRKILRRKEWLPTPVFLPGESHGQRS